MSRRPRFSSTPASEGRANSLTPKALTRQEFARRLQQMLHDRNWSQADLARAMFVVGGGILAKNSKLPRDAVSTYIGARSFPDPKNIDLLCKALEITRDELLPNAKMYALSDEHPAFEMKVSAGNPGQAWVRLNRLVSIETATSLVALLGRNDAQP